MIVKGVILQVYPSYTYYIYTQQKEQGSSTSTVESISPRAIQLHRMKGRQYTYYDGANDVKKGVITNLKWAFA